MLAVHLIPIKKQKNNNINYKYMNTRKQDYKT